MAERANNSLYSGAQIPRQPPTVGSMDPPRGFVPPIPLQYRPVVPAPQPPQYAPLASHHFQPAGQGVPIMIAGFPTQPLQPPFRPLMHQLPARPGPPAPSHVPPPPQFAPTSYGQPQQTVNVNTGSQYPAGGQLGVSVSHSTVFPTVSHSTVFPTPLQHTHGQMAASTASAPEATLQHKSAEGVQTDWIEHTSADGRRYYHNKKTRQSTWDKPFELMTIIERADASTEWKEFTSPDGRTYYYNKVTRQSKWSLPDELKLARKQAVKASTIGTQSETSPNSQTSNSVPTSVVRAPSSISSSLVQVDASSPVAAVPVVAASEIRPAMISAPSASLVMDSSVVANADGVSTTGDARTPMTDVSSGLGDAVTVNTVTETKNDSSNFLLAYNVVKAADKVPAEVVEETRKDAVKGEKFSDALEEKTVEQEQLAYTNKSEAKNAFKALLESANVGSDWTWDQAMRAIINDRRYGALRTLGERKTAFNEFLGQRKKQEAEERRSKQKKAREDYKKMLEESVELMSSSRWSKAVTMFENDKRFKALERERDRKDLFDDHLEELKQKERANVMEERKRNILEYRKFLESCAFIKASTQWRKVQDRLEADERCSRLEKMDRLEIFQEYLNDLEKEEEEQRKIQKEELSKAERKNRDEFRKLMEVDVASGILTAKTKWRDYCIKVKDLPAYMGVASNTSGSTPKDLFEDVAEELQKQFQEDKTRIKDAVKLRKIALSSSCTFEDFKGYVLEDVTSPPISDVNFKIVFDDLLIKVKEKEEKEAKKRKRLEDDFFDLLCSIKEISASSTWESCRQLLEGSRVFSSIGDESICRGIFDEFVMQLKEQAKEYEQKRKEVKAKRENEREERDRRKQKQGREKERARERGKEGQSKKDGADSDHADSAEYDNRRSGKDDDEKHRKRHQGALDSLDEIEKNHSKNSHRHNSDSKKSRRHLSTLESENESRHKRHKRDHRNDSHKNGDHDDLEDGEFSGAIRFASDPSVSSSPFELQSSFCPGLCQSSAALLLQAEGSCFWFGEMSLYIDFRVLKLELQVSFRLLLQFLRLQPPSSSPLMELNIFIEFHLSKRYVLSLKGS